MNNIKKLSGKSFEAFELKWDTNYFGVKSAKAVLKDSVLAIEETDLKKFLDEFEFVTITNLKNISYNNLWIVKETSAFLVDVNIQFIKDIRKLSSIPVQNCEVFEAYPQEKYIMEIAEKAFNYSRFFNDPNLPKEKAQKIYVQWVKSAFNQKGRYFTLYKKNGKIIGFLLFSLDENALSSTIELIAVDESHRGYNIGKSLINSMEAFIYNKKGITKIRVGTQIDNISAFKFYIANGFQYTYCNTVYHYWPQKETS